MSNFIKIRPVEAELFHVVGRTDRHDEANSHFSKFCESAQKPTNLYLERPLRNFNIKTL